MSGLAHCFEDEGIATSIVALVRPHAEHMRPPRTLWVPFELGRPLGTPNDAALQARVLRATLALFGTAAEPGTIVDFDGEQPDAADDPAWVNPVRVNATNVREELEQVRPVYEQAVRANGRSTLGLSGLSVKDAADFLCALEVDAATPSPREGFAAAQVMRFAADDLKAFYLEAASSGNGRPSSRQLGDWLWQDTQAGHLIRALRRGSLDASDAARRVVGSSSLVTAEWAQRLDPAVS